MIGAYDSFVGMVPKPVHENRSSKVFTRAPSYAARLLEGSKFLRNETSFLGTVVDTRNKSILVHPLMEAFLVIKWSRMRRIFYANFIYYVSWSTQDFRVNIFELKLMLW